MPSHMCSSSILIWLACYIAMVIAQSTPTSTSSTTDASATGSDSAPEPTSTSHTFSPGATLAPGATCDPASTYALGHSCDGSNGGAPTISVNPSIVEGISCDPKTRKKAAVTLSASTTSYSSQGVVAKVATTSSNNAAPTAVGGVAMAEAVAALWMIALAA